MLFTQINGAPSWTASVRTADSGPNVTNQTFELRQIISLKRENKILQESEEKLAISGKEIQFL